MYPDKPTASQGGRQAVARQGLGGLRLGGFGPKDFAMSRCVRINFKKEVAIDSSRPSSQNARGPKTVQTRQFHDQTIRAPIKDFK